MPERVPEGFVQVLEDLGAWLEDAGIAAIVVGGVAASILGRPRATRDIDALAILPEKKWADAAGSTISRACAPGSRRSRTS
jgi:hypothetical protein